jgi:hypothetical protein
MFQVRQLVPESEAYMSLLSFEQKLDRTLTRKKYDFQEAVSALSLINFASFV